MTKTLKYDEKREKDKITPNWIQTKFCKGLRVLELINSQQRKGVGVDTSGTLKQKSKMSQTDFYIHQLW